MLVSTPIRCRGLSEKLLCCCFGPFKVVRRVSELDYEVYDNDYATASCLPRTCSCRALEALLHANKLCYLQCEVQIFFFLVFSCVLR